MSRLTLIDLGQTFVQISLGDADLVSQISLGDDNKAKFWHDTRLDGRAPIGVSEHDANTEHSNKN